jgi:2-C-methyl-D-erythritol 4-phosphate cytidylyltransferase
MDPGAKKELRLVAGVPAIRKCVEAFVVSGCCNHFVVTHSETGKPQMEAALAGLSSKIIWVRGGATRQQSVYRALNALAELKPGVVLIHDGARPWISPSLIRSVFEGTVEFGACIPVVPLTDAPKRISAAGCVAEHMDKTAIANAQTPQGFRFAEILEAHKAARASGNDYSDDAEAYDAVVGPVFTVVGDPANRKITYGCDLA